MNDADRVRFMIDDLEDKIDEAEVKYHRTKAEKDEVYLRLLEQQKGIAHEVLQEME